MRDCDCLIIGYNDIDFRDFVNLIQAMGRSHAEYKNLDLNFVEYNGRHYRPLELLTHFYSEGKSGPVRPFHNNDLLSPVIIYLGTYLSRRGFTFDYINLFNLQRKSLRKRLEGKDFLAVAITTTYYIFDLPILDIVSFIRRYDDGVKIILGGPYISKRSETLDPVRLKAFFRHLGADFYVRSREGELALARILGTLKNRREFSRIPNISYKHGEDYVINPLSAENNDLAANMVDYSLFPQKDLGALVNLRFSKGCPYACAFCGFPQKAARYQYTTVAQVEGELEALRRLGTVSHLFLSTIPSMFRKRDSNH